ncbi:MAG: double zinc ribbon domain-containing protein [Mariprofundales bacterium]|nr:double zinc ribbon domain-containing protein [Mariprofundales bacterium]
MSITSISTQLRDLLFPPACLICQQALNNSASVCQECNSKITPLVQPRLCCRCALPLPAEELTSPCGTCLVNPPAHQRAISLFVYREAVRDAILRWKLGGDGRAIEWLLAIATETVRHTIQPPDLLIPIPMPLQRMRKTGQHHAANLCRAVAERTGCRWEWRWLRRCGSQPRQSALSIQKRRKNLRRAFQLDRRYQPELTTNSTIWLIDDIMTTGATMNFAARAITRYHPACGAFTLARTLRNS